MNNASILSPADSLVGVPRPVNDRQASRPTIPPDTGPPPALQMQQIPGTWPELADLLGRAGASSVRQWMHEAKADPGGKLPSSPRGSVLAIVSLVISIIALAGVIASVLAHQVGSASYEVQQAEANQAFREELAAQRESITLQREAIYLLIDVLCVNDPRVCAVERKLQR